MATIPDPNKKETSSSIPLEETPEFQKALQEKLKEVISTTKQAVPASDGVDPANMKFVEQLAMAIAQLSDQGTGRKRVAPEIIASRFEAREKMKELILSARANKEVPIYTLVNKVYLDEIMVDPFWVGADHIARKTEIEWPGVPNEAMRPANEIASKIYSAFLDSIGSIVKVVEDDELRVTAGGLTVRGKSNTRQTQEVDSGEGLKLRGRGMAGTPTEINILGTIAPPAQQRI